MRNITQETVTVDSLKTLYLDIKEKLIHPSEITTDITNAFWRGIREKLIKGEQLKIVIKGQTTKGKSTAGLYIKWVINRIIQDLKLNTSYTGEEDEYSLISANQIEFMRVARRRNLRHVCCQIDEFSNMARSGLNSTTEENMWAWYDKVCAQKYLHLIYCTPGRDFDRYGIIVLDILDVDKEKSITRMKVYYNNPTDPGMIFLGYLTIDVTEILNKDWYRIYRRKKNYAMDLLLQESIKDIRELEFALVSLIGYEKCKRLAKLGVKENEIVGTRVDGIIRETKAVYSLTSRQEVITKVRALITPIVLIRKAQDEIDRPRVKKLTPKQIEEKKEEIKIYEEELKELYEIQLELVELYLKYASIGDKNAEEEVLKLCKKYNIPISEVNEDGSSRNQ